MDAIFNTTAKKFGKNWQSTDEAEIPDTICEGAGGTGAISEGERINSTHTHIKKKHTTITKKSDKQPQSTNCIDQEEDNPPENHTNYITQDYNDTPKNNTRLKGCNTRTLTQEVMLVYMDTKNSPATPRKLALRKFMLKFYANGREPSSMEKRENYLNTATLEKQKVLICMGNIV